MTSKDNSPAVCAVYRSGVGVCGAGYYNGSLPSEFRYFSDPSFGGYAQYDYCSVVSTLSNMRCVNAASTLMPRSIISASAKCIDRAGDSILQLPICVEFQCDTPANTIRARFSGALSSVDCPEGKEIDAYTSSSSFSSGSTVVCPPYSSVCSGTFDSLAITVSRLGHSVDLDTDAAPPGAQLLPAVVTLSSLAVLVLLLYLPPPSGSFLIFLLSVGPPRTFMTTPLR